MTKKDLFRLIIKILGLYFLITTAFGIFPTILTFIQSWKFFLETSSVLGNIVIILLLSIFLIYEPDKIIDWLKLDKNFDNNKIELEKLGAEDILKIAIITGILLADEVAKGRDGNIASDFAQQIAQVEQSAKKMIDVLAQAGILK